MNRVVLFGRIGTDPELRMTQSGKANLRLRLATSERVKRGDKFEELTEWHNVTLWGKRAEGLAKHLQKGSKVLFEGRLHYSEYEDRDGNKKYSTEIVADHVEFGGDKKKSTGGGGSSGGMKPAEEDEPPFDGEDDIPF